MVKKVEKADYQDGAASSIWDKMSAEILYTNYLERCIENHYQVEQKYLDSFTPVILAGGENIRMGPFPKPLQMIEGVPAVVRIIEQLKKTGFEENDIYVVTRNPLDADYRSEAYWFFERGLGRRMKVKNITFSEPHYKAEVIKRFAEGELETAKIFGSGGIVYETERPALKKNLLVLAADNVLFSSAPLRVWVNECGEFLSEESNGFMLLNLRSPELSVTYPENDYELFGYAFDREACREVEIPKEDVSVSGFVCEKINMGGKKGHVSSLHSFFFNINDPALYNMALNIRLSANYRFDAKSEDAMEIRSGLKYQTSKARLNYTVYWPLSIPHIRIKVPLWMGVYAARESGLEAYLEKSGWDFDSERYGIKFCSHPDYDMMHKMFCFAIGNSAFMEKNDIGRCLKAEAMSLIDYLLEESKERAPELKEYINKAIKFGKENKKGAKEYAVKMADKIRLLDKIDA